MVGRAHLKIHGDVSTVLRGEVGNPPEIDPASFSYALGAGLFSAPDFYGETLIFDHVAWGTIVKEGQVCTEKAEKRLKTPFLLGISIEKEPEIPEIHQKISIQDIYKEKKDVAVVGYCRFATLEATYLKRSPIYHENILEHKEQYWEVETYSDQSAYLFGVILSNPIPQAFYVNPGETTPSAIVSHTHIALTDHLSQKLSTTGIRHLLTHSVLKEGRFLIYSLNS